MQCKYNIDGKCEAPIAVDCGDECGIKALLIENEELKRDVEYYKRQMYFVIEQKEKLEKQMDLTS